MWTVSLCITAFQLTGLKLIIVMLAVVAVMYDTTFTNVLAVIGDTVTQRISVKSQAIKRITTIVLFTRCHT